MSLSLKTTEISFRMLIASVVILSYWTVTGHAQGQEQNSKILGIEIEVSVASATDLVGLLKSVAAESGVPMGLEFAASRQTGTFRLAGRKKSLREILDSIIAQDPRYTWTITNGVVNLLPKADRDSVLADLLTTRISKVLIRGGQSYINLRNDLVDLPEVRGKLEKLNLVAGVFSVSGADHRKVGRADFTQDLSGATLKEILNFVASNSTSRFWVLNRFGKDRRVLILNF